MEENISFEDLGLDEITLNAIALKGFEVPSPIQVLAIPRLLGGEANVIAKARTGTGKTAAFGLPLVQTIREDKGHVRALILAPTRELALQVCKEIDSLTTGTYPRLAAVYGGQSMGEQLRALKRGVEIVVGTPGRVQDHIERKSLDLSQIDYFILDEADEMLDMGFIDDIEAIFAKANPESRILLFSATMPQPILKIASRFMGDYEIVEEETSPEEPVLTEQKYWIVRESDKIEALVRLIDISPDFYGLVFTQTKADADMITRQLDERGYEAAALHGDIPQAQREKILYRFRNKKTRILVATDVAARGIDIEGLTHVVNYALPFDGPTYVHRIGRTGRAGAKGLAFTLVRPEERRKLEYLKAAVRKSAKGTMTEAPVPPVSDVLAAKRARLFDAMKLSLANGGQSSDDAAGNADGGESADGFAPPRSAGEDSVFARMAEELCSGKDPQDVLASVLKLSYGKQLDPSRYGDISTLKAFNPGKQIRLFVQLGRRDGFYPREIAEYFSKLLNIQPRLVDRIDVAENFSLVSLPMQAGMDALERSKRDHSLPHMHIDSKDAQNGESGFANRPGRRGFGNAESRSGGFRREGREFRHDGGRGFGRDSERSGGGRSRPPHARQGSAGLYKRKTPQSDRY
ncbi:DEAD/DEAH box helicase [Treponema brennaborense]|uniref:RNA helicase n=1 Tax=Treponema brennaborense (strain DSM 12168 / CIP 105900 / DD5/3) TaxID=906968 RepID=F4LPS8_TREBD|nr:DEAD/DEAH box helicase [Treponema brennaborense]AEE16020.1 DEAD/DEAH box helicase domain protein [Treponema brennaborense DSM 12168]